MKTWYSARKAKVIAFALAAAAALGLLLFKEPLMLEWHKWRLQSVKDKYRRLLNTGMTGREKAWAHLTGRPIATEHLQRVWREHEDILVRAGFLQREQYVSLSGYNPAFSQAIGEMERECRWWSMRREWETNLIVTACAGGMDKWRQRAREFGLVVRRRD